MNRLWKLRKWKWKAKETNVFLEFKNDGARIERTNYWQTSLVENGLAFCSVNDGAIRVLLPPSRYAEVKDMRAARSCVLSRGPWPDMGLEEAVEIMWDDDSKEPYALCISPEAFDSLPSEPPAGKEWIVSVWIEQDGAPREVGRWPCHWRRAPRLPYMAPWESRP